MFNTCGLRVIRPGSNSLVADRFSRGRRIQLLELVLQFDVLVEDVLEEVLFALAFFFLAAGLLFGKRAAGQVERQQHRVVWDVQRPRIDLLFSRLRMLRQWGGIVDVCPDASPIIGKTPVEGLFFNCGWGTGGFKATPGSGWVFAYTIAQDRPHVLNLPFALERFTSGYLIDEHGAAGVAH